MQQTFYIRNTTRSPHTRDVRRSVPGPESSTKNLFIGGGLVRVVRGRPSPVTGAFILRHAPELLDKERKGLLSVYNGKSQLIDISTLAPRKGTTTASIQEEVQEVEDRAALTSIDAALQEPQLIIEGERESEPVASDTLEPVAAAQAVVEAAPQEVQVGVEETPEEEAHVEASNPFFPKKKKGRK